MSIRKDALKWYESKYGRVDLPIYTSKFYQPNKSWPKKNVCWPQIPTSEIDKTANSFINILCQVSPNENDFHHLRVPTKFLRENFHKFHSLKNKLTLYLSTDP